MALLKSLKSFPELFGTKKCTADCAFDGIETPAFYFDLTKICLKKVQAMTSLRVPSNSPKFNHEQCKQLADKLKVTVDSASSFLLDEYPTWLESEDMAKSLESFKLLFASAKQVQSFIQSFCKLDAYSLAAVILPNVFEQFSLLDFDLELCRFAFSGNNECVTSQNATSTSIAKEIMLTNILKVLIQSNKSGDEDCLLASFLLERLERSIQRSSRESRVHEVDYRRLQQKEKLGSGATCTVHKAIWLGAPVAMKTYFVPNHADFKKEVAILAGLSHPNVLSLLGSIMDDRWCGFVTELMDGDLYSLIQARVRLPRQSESHDSMPFSDLESVHLVLQIAEGMLYLHNNRIVHRDLKSNNILVKHVKAAEVEIRVKATKVDFGYVHVKVGDFGLAKTKETSTHSNQTPNVGTHRWMAPEVIRFQDEDGRDDEDGKVTKLVYDPFKADVYSFAMVCYEVLSGNVPFSTTNKPREVKKKILLGERPIWPKQGLEKLKALVEKCWSNEASTRPSFDVICAELRLLKCSLVTVEGKRKDKYPEHLETSTYTSSTILFQKLFFTLPGKLMFNRPIHFFLAHAAGRDHSVKNFSEWLYQEMRSTWRYKYNLFTVFFNRRSLSPKCNLPEEINRALAETQVGVVVVSEDFFIRKWSMMELLSFMDSKKRNPTRVRILPLFYRLQAREVKNMLKEGYWDEKWKEMSTHHYPMDVNKCRGAVEELYNTHGIEYKFSSRGHDAEYIKEILKVVVKISDQM